VFAVTSKPSSGSGRVHALIGGPAGRERVGSVELLGREGVELVASIGPEIELGVGSFVEAVDGRRDELRQRSHRYIAALKMCGEVVEDCAPAGNHFGEELVLPIGSASVSTRDDADHATAARR
jgi:hypothetical protein